jgi:hypothetical protein
MLPRLAFEYNYPGKQATIYGEVNELGVLEFVVQVSPDSPIRGAELFRRMMLAFGDDVVAIRGVWRKGDRPSANIDKVNELTRKGMTLTEAVLHAWTVRRAKEWGFTKVGILGQPTGTPGNYTKIDVFIEKP